MTLSNDTNRWDQLQDKVSNAVKVSYKKKFMVGKFLKIIIFMIIIEKKLKGKEITYL